jgi:hypothetical protein
MQKIMLKPNQDHMNLMPKNDFSKNSFAGYNGIFPEYKNSNSFDSLRDGLNGSRKYDNNLQNMKGIANLVNNLQNIYQIENDDGPSQPPSIKIDSLFKNNGNINSQFLSKPDAFKMHSGLSNQSFGLLDQKSRNIEKEPKNDMSKAYNYLKNNLSDPKGYLKLNLGDMNKEDDLNDFDNVHDNQL